jgi:YD repeat-containing protein
VQCFGSATYDVAGRLQETLGCEPAYGIGYRNHSIGYDDQGRPTSASSQTGIQSNWQVTRSWGVLSYDADSNALQIQGSDGQTTEFLFGANPGYDELGRPKQVVRADLSAEFSYDDAGRLARIDYGNGTAEVYTYDDADRLLSIEHRDSSDNVLLAIAYEWNLDNTVASRTETDNVAGEQAEVTFQYDRRSRLIRETRVVDGTTEVYDIEYSYDALGNRLEKLDHTAGLKTCYAYDVQYDEQNGWAEGMCFEPAAPEYVTRNNRLLEYRLYRTRPAEHSSRRA